MFSLAAAPLSHATFPGRNGKIAFDSARTGWYQIYTVDPDGSNVTQLTNHPLGALGPSWSPDGSRIAYSVEQGGDLNTDLYRINQDGGVPTRLTDHEGRESYPAWSPDGTKIVFTRFTLRIADSFSELLVMSADGGNATPIASGAGSGADPSWSPDGMKILANGGGLFTIEPDGSNRTQMTNNPTDGNADWSPDGTKIVFHRNVHPEAPPQNFQIFSMNADGTGEHRLTNTSVDDSNPVWSPDGTKIAFSRLDSRGFWTDIWVMDADGSNPFLLTGVPNIHDGVPSWQPLPNRPPACSSVVASPDVLRPPNKALRRVLLSGASDPDGDITTIRVDSVTQDEPLTVRGDRTTPDARLLPADGVKLRAERDQRGDGRAYEIGFTVTDPGGLSCSGSVTVSVPRHKNKPAKDSRPPEYDSLG